MEADLPVPKKCYYETMNVKSDCTQEDIKRSFKKMSLKYHPDKNRKDPETAKRVFQDITEAYNCIIDPKERLWYDNNREKLLMNKKDMSKEDLELQSYGFDIFALFESDAFEGFGDNKESFFSVYRTAFEQIDYEEERTFKFQSRLAEKENQNYKQLPTFGDKDTPIEQVIEFYDTWKVFSTLKLFAWADEHDTREGENRWEKRSMQGDNEKLRRKEKKKYCSTIQDLVQHIKKSDPRREQLKELERLEQIKIEAQREGNKSEKQKKKEKAEKERLEKLAKKEEEAHQAWIISEEKRLKQIEEQKIQAAEALKQKAIKKVDNKKKDKGGEEELDQKAFDELLEIQKNGGTLTKKQAKQLKKVELIKKAEADKLKQQKLQQDKKTKQVDQSKEQQQKQNEQDQEIDNDIQSAQKGDAPKKRKRNKKKKNNANDEEEGLEETEIQKE